MLSIVKELFGMVIPVFTVRCVVVIDPPVFKVMFGAVISPVNDAPDKLALVFVKSFQNTGRL